VLTVTVIGTNVSTTADAGGAFTLTNVPAGTVRLHFQGRGADAMVTSSGITADDHLQIAVTFNGSNARLESSERVSGNRGGSRSTVASTASTVARARCASREAW